MNVRCPACNDVIALAAGDMRLACAACGLATPVSQVGTAPGVALVALEADLTGRTLAGYTIVERIGAGGMGTVYRAHGDGREVAIKVLRPSLGADRAAVLARFAREAEALRRLRHPRVVRLLAHGQDGDVAYIVTELVRGRDLAATLAADRMSLADIVNVFEQVCDGVAAAHAAGIVHRDLKPANILVGEDRGVKVADFGLAQLGPDAAITTLTRTDVAMGTFHYLAPEQRKDARAVDHRADIWALGVILYEMLTGELPLGSFAPPSTKGPPGCDRRCDAIVRRALAPDPGDRFASVAELGHAVRALVANRGVAHRWLAIAAVGVLGLGTAGAVALASMDGEPPIEPVARAASPLDAGVPSIGASVDAAALLDASLPIDAVFTPPAVDASVPIDAAVVVTRRPPSIVKRRPSKPAPPPVPAVCRQAERCCLAIEGKLAAKQGRCTYRRADAATCESALADLQVRATTGVQKKTCGV